MKKILLKSFLIALGLTALGMLINFVFYSNGEIMPLAHTVYGGEIIIDMGFGLCVSNIYSMLPDGGTTVFINFDPFSLIICLAGLTIIVFVILLVINKIWLNRE